MLDYREREDHESSVSPRSSPKLRSKSPHRSVERPSAAFLRVQRDNSTTARPRNISPYSRTHLRNLPGGATLQPPPMTRTRSLPIVTTVNRSGLSSPSHSPVRPSSPLRSPAATRAYPRRSLEDIYAPNSVPSFMDIESIAEDSELDLSRSRHQGLDRDGQGSPFAFASHSVSYPRPHRRRPVSPLHLTQPASTYSSTTSPSSSSSSPSLAPMRYNEAYPPYSSTSFSLSGYSSSMPSTPTSFRSRSPSVSSLETIPDSPDAEDEAVQDEQIAKLKAAADAADAAEVESARRSSGSSLDVPRNGLNNGAGGREKRKRWSVCGGERSGAFEMETIWED